jgi:hypothetical protein
MVYANPVGHGMHCMQPVAWVGRWKFTKGWTKVWSCQRHAEELPWARRLPGETVEILKQRNNAGPV